MVELLQAYPIEEILIIAITCGAIALGIYKFISNSKAAARFRTIEDNVSLLLDSDKARIKGEILREHTRCVERGGIDPYTLEYLHAQYDIYKAENGNSFVEELMKSIDSLPILGKKAN